MPVAYACVAPTISEQQRARFLTTASVVPGCALDHDQPCNHRATRSGGRRSSVLERRERVFAAFSRRLRRADVQPQDDADDAPLI
jgi:hypothetical protein